MKLGVFIAARPIFVLILLGLLVLILPSLVISRWYKTTKRIEDNVDLSFHILYSELQSGMERVSDLLHPLTSSVTHLARIFSSISQTEISFDEIETEVAPMLFQSYSTVPFISQVSYVGLGGLLFSYHFDGNQTLSTYANSSIWSNSSDYVWYNQVVDDRSGKLYGNAVQVHSLNVVNTSWFQAALKDDQHGYASIEKGWSHAADPSFLTSASVHGNGVVSLAFSVKRLTNIFAGIDLNGGSLSLASMDGKMLVNGIPNTKLIYINNSIVLQLLKPTDEAVHVDQNFSCTSTNGTSTHVLDIYGKNYNVRCSTIDILGVKSLYALALPSKEFVSHVQRESKLSLILLLVMIVMVLIPIFSFVLLIVKMAEREMCLYAKLMKQMETTQQAERKSMNKSIALAGASHDIRASLAGITGLVDLCLTDADPSSDAEAYLRQMHDCSQDLLGLLNSILDSSKIEAGMMNLEEENFNLAELVEHITDLYHPVGVQKGVDVMLDLCDGSIIKYSLVKGDRKKLMQILSNLLSNAVKFTAEGHVSVRTWVQKPTLEATILASSKNGLHKYLSCLFSDKNEARDNMGTISALTRQSPHSMEFVFEVDDTGKGIPKEKQKAVFNNFVQVKETAAGQTGTGLGLGIVQSLVRLMGGEIGIVDKDIGEKGTCFRFNVFLTACENSSSRGEKELQGGSNFFAIRKHPSPRLEGSLVVLFMQNDERRRISQKFMESLGISISVVDRWEFLPSELNKIKSKFASSGRLDLSPTSDMSGASSKDMPLSALEGTDHKLHSNKRRGSLGFILLVIDASAGPFSELWKVVTEFCDGLKSTSFKVVWLDKPTSRSINGRIRGDEILLRPFHGSRILQVIKFLPEFRGISSQRSLANQQSSSPSKHSNNKKSSRHHLHDEEIQETRSSNFTPQSSNKQLPEFRGISSQRSLANQQSSSPSKHSNNKKSSRHHLHDEEIQETRSSNFTPQSSNKQPLSGKKILVVEDNLLLRKLALVIVRRLGASVEHCENGKEALKLVCNGLQDMGTDAGLPYDYILMDCEMPVMNGYEATIEIRKEEQRFRVHIPIIALTAHTSGSEARMTLEIGMDAHLGKPLNEEELMETIESLHKKWNHV